jgi:ankyrin repeat protein
MDLIDAIIIHDIQSVKCLLEEGADPNQIEDIHKVTPLHYAVTYQCTDAIPLLVTAGANINAKTVDDITPIELARLLNAQESVQVLNNYI